MVHVYIPDGILEKVRKLHRRYTDLSAKDVVTVALQDYVELVEERQHRGDLP